MTSGLFNIYKDTGISSAKVVSQIKQKLIQQIPYKIKVGHFGTLDPAAQGVILVAIGRATRLFDYYINKIKTYKVSAIFGMETNSLDMDGIPIKYTDKIPSQDEIKEVLECFKGKTYMQIPPKVSAKNISGKRAYKLAKSGVSFELKPQQVEILDLKIIQPLTDNTIEILISCGKGFYVRSFIRDVAYACDSLATVTKLERVKVGEFDASTAISANDIDINKNLYPLDSLLDNLDSISIPKVFHNRLLNGVKIGAKQDFPKLFKAYINDNFIGIGENINGVISIKTWLI